jgi:hypothetical protein
MRQRVSLPLVLDHQGRVRLLIALMVEAEMRCKLGTDSGVISHQLFYQSIEIGTDFSWLFILLNVLQGLTSEPNIHCSTHCQHMMWGCVHLTNRSGRKMSTDVSYPCRQIVLLPGAGFRTISNRPDSVVMLSSRTVSTIKKGSTAGELRELR